MDRVSVWFGVGVVGFGYEKLEVYRRAMAFLEYRDEVLKSLRFQVAAYDHLIRASESVPINIAHGSASLNPKERVVFLGYANGSALECAACLDDEKRPCVCMQ